MNLMDRLFGCSHPRYTWPRGRKQHYVCCLTCGKEFAYDWQQMKVVPNREKSTQLFSIAVDSRI